jgi:RNA polymerase sigma-70 factor, ECF subfamily
MVAPSPATPVMNLTECLQAVSQGDHASAGQLMKHLQPLVHRLVRRHLPRREAEEDLQQQVWIKLFQKLGDYHPRPGIPFEHWVSRLTVHTCLDALRAEKARPEWRQADLSAGESLWYEHLMQSTATAPPSDLAGEASSLLERLLGELPPADRLVLTLLDLEERSTQEISDLTGWTRPGVKMRAMRARHRLKAAAHRLYPTEKFTHPSTL